MMWTLELPIESYPKILEEYGRGAIITTNVEYFLKDRIKQRGGVGGESQKKIQH